VNHYEGTVFKKYQIVAVILRFKIIIEATNNEDKDSYHGHRSKS